MWPVLKPWVRPPPKAKSKEKIAAYVAGAVKNFKGKLKNSTKFQAEEIFKKALETVKKDYPPAPKSQTEAYTNLRLRGTNWPEIAKTDGYQENWEKAKKRLNDDKEENKNNLIYAQDVQTAIERFERLKADDFLPANSGRSELKNALALSLTNNMIYFVNNQPAKGVPNLFLNLSSFQEGQAKGMEALVAKLEKIIAAEKEFYPAYAFYHARPASFAVLYDITSEMKRITQGSPELQAWRLEVPTEEDWDQLLKKNKNAKDNKEFIKALGQMGMAQLQSLEAKFTDCFSFAAVGFAYDDSAMVLFIQGNPVNQEEETLNGIIKKVLGIGDNDGRLINFIQEAQDLSIQKMGTRLYQAFVHPDDVNDLAWMVGTNPKKVLFYKDDKEVELKDSLQDLREMNTQEFLNTYFVSRQSRKQKLSDKTSEGFLTLGLGLRFEKEVQNRLRSHHPALYDPSKTLIKQYYSLDPSKEEQEQYQRLIRKIAIALLEKHLKEKASNAHLDGPDKNSTLQKALTYLGTLRDEEGNIQQNESIRPTA